MKRFILLSLLCLFILLTGCQKIEISPLEQKVKEYDTYATLVNYQENALGKERDLLNSIKVVAVTKDNSLFYLFEVQTNHNMPILRLSVDQIELKVYELKQFEQELMIINANSLPDGNVLKVYLGHEDFNKDYNQEKNYNRTLPLVNDVDDLKKLNVLFKDTSEFDVKEIKTDFYGSNQDDYLKTFVIITSIGIILGLISFKLYKIIFQHHIERKLIDVNYHKKLIDLGQFKVYCISFVSVIGLIIFLSIIFTTEYHIKNQIRYIKGLDEIETITNVQHDINMRVTITETSTEYKTVIFEKPVGGTDYDYEITFNQENQSFIRVHTFINKEVFENINYETMEVRVYDKYNNDELLLYRKYDLK